MGRNFPKSRVTIQTKTERKRKRSRNLSSVDPPEWRRVPCPSYVVGMKRVSFRASMDSSPASAAGAAGRTK